MLGWLAMALGLAAALLLLRAGQAVAELVSVSSLTGSIVLFYGAVFGPLVVLSLALGKIEGRSVLRGGTRRLRWATIGLVTGAGGLGAAALFAWLHGVLAAAPIGDGAADRGAGFIALGLAITVLQVLAEELLFRGWLLAALLDRMMPALAIGLSAAAFSLFHLIGGAQAPLSLLNLMLGGVWFGLLAWRSGGILAPFMAHFGWNVAEDMGLGLVPNPGVGEFGALSDHDIIGPALWGGSDDGLNASIAMTIVLVALIIPLLARRARA